MSDQWPTAAEPVGEFAEADRWEQAIPVDPDDEGPRPASAPLEANEADALEQAIEVPDDEDYPPGP